MQTVRRALAPRPSRRTPAALASSRSWLQSAGTQRAFLSTSPFSSPTSQKPEFPASDFDRSDGRSRLWAGLALAAVGMAFAMMEAAKDPEEAKEDPKEIAKEINEFKEDAKAGAKKNESKKRTLRKRKTSVRDGKMVVSTAAVRGDRAYMEDTSYVSSCKRFAAVYDGHGGAGVSQYLRNQLFSMITPELAQLDQEILAENKAENNVMAKSSRRQKVATMLRNAVHKLDQEVIAKNEWKFQGSTAVGVLLFEDVLYSLNVGDSRAVLCRGGEVVELTRDHKPNDPQERARIESLGGRVQWYGYVDAQGEPIEPYGAYRVNGNLAVARAIGDRDSRPFVIGEAEIRQYDIEYDKDEFIVIASDGLWDVFTSSEVVEFVQDVMSVHCEFSLTQKSASSAHYQFTRLLHTMNSPTASSTSSMDDTGSNPIFQVQSAFDDELQLQFANSTPVYQYVPGEITSPVTQYRDAPFQFTTASMDQLEELDSFSLYPGKQPMMELSSSSKQKEVTASPLSPSAAVEIPIKEGWDSFFGSAFPSFPSFANPEKIMTTVQNALQPFECSVRLENHWTFRVSWLCVAEEIAFSISLSKEQSEDKYEVAFRREFGDEMTFHQLVECIRARCGEVDAEPLFFAESTLEPWLDAKQELKGRRYAIRDTEAAQLIKEMNAELDAETLYEVAKMVKNHCRHHGNRRLFLEADRSGFVQAIKWMLADSEVFARFAAFILLQYAKESCHNENTELFSSAFERNSVELLLSELECRESDSTCSQFTIPMLAEIQQSWIFA
ncbi:Hypothetical protein PHPALM_18124 [Phytophthora palmivora]|uniref:protein-serine/threonine phosphatase n=1 Tax=Phytophthora palmivora TaxID=4796 RepID=A0A2P4XKI6_9STRA|nr:Hypothetical protein PHPALM_18124 [Phytophthora palmivora]